MYDDEKRVWRWVILGIVIVATLVFIPTCVVQCTKVDSAEVGIKFNKLSLTDQGKLDATTVSGFVFYNPIKTDVYTYETRVRQCNYIHSSFRQKMAPNSTWILC